MNRCSLFVCALLMSMLAYAPAAMSEPPGTFDSSFGVGGMAEPDFHQGNPRALLTQPDDKIVVAGTCHDQEWVGVARMNPDGTPDRSFGDGGAVCMDVHVRPGDFSGASSIFLQADGKLLLGGEVRSIYFVGTQQHDDQYALLVRLNANGSRDRSFADNGVLIDTIASPMHNQEKFSSVIQDSLGSITAFTVVQPDETKPSQVAMVRYGPSGARDNSFGSGGYVIHSVPGLQYVNDVYGTTNCRPLPACHG